MNGYELSRNWFDFCFENPEKINPNHTAIYFFAIEHCNRLGWKKKFGFPSQMTMDALGIKKNQTYIKYFNDLVEWKFFKLIQKSRNQYSANIISLISAMPKNGEALDKAIIKHAAKQTSSNGQSNSTIDKQENKETNKPINPKETTKPNPDSFQIFFETFPKRFNAMCPNVKNSFFQAVSIADGEDVILAAASMYADYFRDTEQPLQYATNAQNWLESQSWRTDWLGETKKHKANNGRRKSNSGVSEIKKGDVMK